jgi:hypothetical protein
MPFVSAQGARKLTMSTHSQCDWVGLDNIGPAQPSPAMGEGWVGVNVAIHTSGSRRLTPPQPLPIKGRGLRRCPLDLPPILIRQLGADEIQHLKC